MLKVNCGLSRKLTRDFNSHGFSVNIEGEVAVDLNDAEDVVERIQAYYDVAEETLLRQVERYQSDAAIASGDEPAPSPEPARPVAAPAAKPAPAPTPASRLPETRPVRLTLQSLMWKGTEPNLSLSDLRRPAR